MTMTWKLQKITGEFDGGEVSIDRDMLVGRHQDADIQLQSADVSRRHAAFLLKDDALWVQDLKSSNGTFVNDLRVDNEKLLKEGDIVQFASAKFSVLAPAKKVVLDSEIQHTSEIEQSISQPEVPETAAPQNIQQPSEVFASVGVAHPVPTPADTASQVEQVEQTEAQKMNEQGMPSLTERVAETQVNQEGMPQQVSIPKPAPIPEGVDLNVKPEPKAVVIPEEPSVAHQQQEEKKNASVGLMTIIVLIILAIAAWLLFK